MTPKTIERVECEVYTRCCGYYRPTKQMNDAKVQEILDRTTYQIKQEQL